MKRIVRFLLCFALLPAVAMPARALNPFIGLSCMLADEIRIARDLSESGTIRADFAISKFDKNIAGAFERLWRRSGNGLSPTEGVVLIVRMVDGSYSARDMGKTNEYKRFTFRWHPGAIAIVHTHPNASDPKPHDEDLAVADAHRVPIFTLTSRGMFVYDPASKRTSLVIKNLDWLDQNRMHDVVAAAR